MNQKIGTGNESNREPAKTTRVPKPLIGVVIFLCAAPSLFTLFGVDFGSSAEQGAFHHTLLEWSAFWAAIFTVILALTHYSAAQEITTPIVGVALFCSASMDVFHALAASHLIPVAADYGEFIPFTWAICRLFNALILIAGVSLFLSGRKILSSGSETGGLAFVLIASAAFGIIAYLVIHICAASDWLPQAQFPDAWIKRPWDIPPLVLYLLAGFILLPRFYKKYPSIFSHALLVSMIPQAAAQIYVAFGSSELFDNRSNSASFLKIVAYLVPTIGLVFDYGRTYTEAGSRARELQATVHALEKSKAAAEASKAEVEKVLRETQEGRAEFRKANQELRRINRAAIGREERMVELKRVINRLSKELNRPTPFQSLDGEDK